ncbi:two component transcriptional regulator, LuxR family [Oscillochloris trichoides DG-6]|uniref:Two component transcriptional regulator, LuxR family n=1 Tax=Oscillochloris trichoides DG-6 TaxID=765420 RepID=E1IBQ6_9CHLR|nr:response regulator transcription factor [Oscillochloris trichoides]EFO81358.1 two component transcriptional regulator, LuxR family [Oscillochloris trichoides DG-6]
MRVVLIDDHPMFLDGLSSLLTAHGMQVVGMGSNGLEAQHLAQTLRPDLIVMDLHMPVCDGLEATRRITAEWPEVRIVILTVSADEEQLFAALQAGASGYLLKNLHADDFFRLLDGLDQGAPPISPELAQKIDQALVHSIANNTKEGAILTPLQRQILHLVGHGLTYREVAAHIHMSESSIKYHMKQILTKLHLTNRTHAIAYVRRQGGL